VSRQTGSIYAVEYSITWGGDPEDVWMKTRGVVTVAELDAMVREAVADPRWRPGLNILVDHSDGDWSLMSLRDIEDRAKLMIESAETIGYQRIAFVVGHASDFGVARMLSVLVDARVQYLAHAFMSPEEGRAWLAQPDDPADAYVLPADVNPIVGSQG
jgi:hypothetical protein